MKKDRSAAPNIHGLPEPIVPARVLGHPITREIMNALHSQAVLLDAEGQILGYSEDALAALGLERPVPSRFPADPELNLERRGLVGLALPMLLDGEEMQVRLYRDVRERQARDGLLEGLFQELQDLQSGLEQVSARLEDPGACAEAGQPMLVELRQQTRTLEMLIATQRRILLAHDEGSGPVPARPEPEPEPAARDAAPASPEPTDTVLVVDDSAIVRRLLQAILGRANYRVICIGSSLEAVPVAIECQPDMILLDAVMPELDGFQVCSQLKADARTREIPILFVTALRGETDELLALEAGAIDFIPKPISAATVLARVRNHLALKHSKDRLRILSYLDGLTGMANRRQFDQSLEVEWHRCARNCIPISLVMGDVDFFKTYNDHFGHGKGDECLRRVAEVFKGSLRRAGDIAARLGGEEFVCILPGTDRDGAAQVAEQIQQRIRALNLFHPKPVGVPEPGAGHRLSAHRRRPQGPAGGGRPEPVPGQGARPRLHLFRSGPALAAGRRQPGAAGGRQLGLEKLLAVLLGVDLLADLVFLPVQLVLFALGDVAAILGRHVPLLLADVVVLLVQLLGLALGQGAVLDPLVDALVLVVEPAIDLGPPGVVLLPLGLLGQDGLGSHEGRGDGQAGEDSTGNGHRDTPADLGCKSTPAGAPQPGQSKSMIPAPEFCS
jgi:diguanylate cyclase (GGDEF)-like protein